MSRFIAVFKVTPILGNWNSEDGTFKSDPVFHRNGGGGGGYVFGGCAIVLSGVGEADSGGQWGRLAESALTDLKAFQAGGIQVVTVFSVLFVALSVPTR